MTCEECELLLAQNESDPQIDAHVAGCPGCRSLAVELQANAHAMRALGAEALPPLTIPKRGGLPWWKWSSAAAALVITATAAWFASRPPKPPQIVSVDVNVTGIVQQNKVLPVPSPIPEKLTPAVVPVASAEPLRVKMLTPDPDVVIYWLVDSRGELE
jgi:hypothetical protein